MQKMGRNLMKDFSRALEQLKQGNPIRRATWPERLDYIKLEEIGLYDRKDIIYHIKDGERTIWWPSQSDILATDWGSYDVFKSN